MQTTLRKTGEKAKPKEKSKEELLSSRKSREEPLSSRKSKEVPLSSRKSKEEPLSSRRSREEPLSSRRSRDASLSSRKGREEPLSSRRSTGEPARSRKEGREEEKNKKTVYSVSTPRNFVQKSSTADIYAQKKALQATKAPKKVVGTTHTSANVTPTKDYLTSTQTEDQLSFRSVTSTQPKIGSARKVETRPIQSARTSATPRKKELPFSSVTVNSPIAKRKLNLNTDPKVKKSELKAVPPNLERGDSKEIGTDRQRTKTRTLDENEVKVLTTKVVDNNAEMLNLSKKLNAKPKAFYVELNEGGFKVHEKKSSDEEVSYEDDFESYESDFDSYHTDNSAHSTNCNSKDEDLDEEEEANDDAVGGDEEENSSKEDASGEDSPKEVKDEERMMDSGSFDLRDPRSANRSKPVVMAFILEDSEDEKRMSLTDEGFQDMSSSSAVSSLKALQRPHFIDFTKSKETKRKRKLNERLKQRAQDILSMITLHEMSYTLFEMKPIPYDLFMATFGRSNYTQIAVQTFDDGINEEIQTEEITFDQKWTQHPVEFSKHDIHLYPSNIKRRYSRSEEDYLTKFTFLVNNKTNVEINNKINLDKSYKENPLRIYFEQKDGVGSCEMLPYEIYKDKIESSNFDMIRLSKFLKKVENKVSNVLSINAGDKNLSELCNNSKLPFSKGYLSFSTKDITRKEFSFVKSIKINNIIISDTKNNLIMSVHKKSKKEVAEKCVICLWDVSVARREPIKILVAIDNVTIGRFEGGTDGTFVAALEDGSIHLWDLSEAATWRHDVTGEEKPTNLVEVKSDRLTQTEIDREWNLKNSNVGKEEKPLQQALQACAYTSSAANMTSGVELMDSVVGLEFVGESCASHSQDGGRKIVGQVCSLQRIGVLNIWSIVQEKAKYTDIGKAFWSRMKLEKTQTINLLDHIDLPLKEISDDNIISFNLNAAKRRLSNKKVEKAALRKAPLRPKSSCSSEFDISRPTSAASLKRVLSVEKKIPQNWESGIVCYDLKVMTINMTDTFLVAKNFGEVLCCTRIAGAVKVKRFCVAMDTSPVTCLDVSPHGLPYFLAATQSGTVNLCSLFDSRVLLTLDCRSKIGYPALSLEPEMNNDEYQSPLEALSAIVKQDLRQVVPILWAPGVIIQFYKSNDPPTEAEYRCRADNKGRFISSAKVTNQSSSSHSYSNRPDDKLSISSVHWSHSNPCSILTLLRDESLAVWDLTHSDICAKSHSDNVGSVCVCRDDVLAVLTPEGDIHLHRLATDKNSAHHVDLFKKYVTIL